MFKSIFKSREYKKAEAELRVINAWEAKVERLSDEQLQDATDIFKKRLANGETLEDIRVEVFAVAREATKRILKKRPFDVQMIGGLIIDYGSVAEMKTGEGKTITSIAPVYLNALSGKGVMVSTVNEYLTQRDAEEMGQVYNFLGMSVGVILKDMDNTQKREAYAKDITYATHSEIGFDYLRDNMVSSIEQKVQRGFNFILIDEVDSILIDEARTPLIITGGQKSNSKLYLAVDAFVASLKSEHYEIDYESKGISLTEEGVKKANSFFKVDNIFMIQHSELVHRIQNALRAHYIMKKDHEYIIRDAKIELVDAHTGRIMDGRSYSDGLQQAIQAKEKLEIEDETITMATITYQNLFRMFNKLSGMTGTAKTEEDEFLEIYNMRVIEIPTNKPMIRVNHKDVVYQNLEAKYKGIIAEITRLYEKGQPVLVGTSEVLESERISTMLKKKGIPHTVLNAKQNEAEAEIIAKAGEVKSVTIATNMAGRGTDIQPSQDALNLGGLYVLGTSKAESRRIDNQLRGRSGRQGDPGESRFFLSLDDSLIKRFSNQEKLKDSFASYGDKPIENSFVIRALNKAQKRIEGFNFDSRKNILQYDDVIRQQRDLIYAQRDIIISNSDLKEVIERMMRSVAKDVVNFPNFKEKDGTLNVEKMVTSLNAVWFGLVDFKFDIDLFQKTPIENLDNIISNDLIEVYALLRERIIESHSEDTLHNIERQIILRTFDQNWQLHIDQMSKLRSSTSLTSYAQKNPYQVYIDKGSELFKALLERISHNSVRLIMNNQYARPQMDIQELGALQAIQAAKNKTNSNQDE